MPTDYIITWVVMERKPLRLCGILLDKQARFSLSPKSTSAAPSFFWLQQPLLATKSAAVCNQSSPILLTELVRRHLHHPYNIDCNRSTQWL
ncbi:uncharacterized protein LAJ45_07509 [Morchella importuna]|uniref:uncharacterized protein n=1 Tax=Morchella importuna TaxID=1174673 RepID=UPI001E8D59F8|nr:uncharacterized protein LAJ45_07509 [Morchella importuna]KAH8148407.1 hypothetical protein LAJ45_07509 [Morchella importuna]